MNKAKRDQALDALAEIQAMEVECEAVSFRDAHLGGVPFGAWEAAMGWVRSVAGTPGPSSLTFRFESDSVSIPDEVATDREARRSWWQDWIPEHLDELRDVPGLVLSDAHRMFELVDEDGGLVEALYVDPGSALDALDALASKLAKRYRWTRRQAERLILLGETPTLPAVRAQLRHSIRMGEDVTAANSPYSVEITLRCRPQATQQQVAQAYEAARRKTLEGEFGLKLGDRNRATTSDRTRHLAVFGARVDRQDFKSWLEALTAYLMQHPEDSTIYQPEDGHADIGRFRRDVRAAYRRVLGLELDFRPTKRHRPHVDVDVLGEEAADDE